MKIREHSRFRRDFKRYQKKNYDMLKLKRVVELIEADDFQMLKSRYRLHELKGKWKGFYELHIQSDWLLIYLAEDGTCTLVRMGSHEELFF